MVQSKKKKKKEDGLNMTRTGSCSAPAVRRTGVSGPFLVTRLQATSLSSLAFLIGKAETTALSKVAVKGKSTRGAPGMWYRFKWLRII